MAAATEPTENTGQAEDKEEEGLGTVSTIETVGPCKRKIKAEVPHEKVAEELDRNYRELISSVQIPGFRRGHVPRRLIEKRYGEEIEGDVKEALLGISFAEVVKEKDLKVLGKPKFDNIAFQKGEPLRYEVEVEVRPEFELGAYTELAVEGEDPPPVQAEEVDSELETLRRNFAELGAVDPAQAGPEDLYFGHYTLRRDGLRVHSRDDVHFRPDTGHLDGFEVPEVFEKIKARGDSPVFSLRAKVPPDYSEEVLRGSEVDLEFHIEETKRFQLPPADDELAKRYGAESIAALRSQIEKRIDARHCQVIDERLEEKVLEKLAETVQFDLPEGLLEEQLKLMKARLEFHLAQQGRPMAEIEEAIAKIDPNSAGDEIRKDFKRFFILEKVAEKEEIYATEDEVSLRVALLAQAYGRQPSELMEELEESGRLETLRAEIRQAKARKTLRQKATVHSPAVSSPAVVSPAVVSPPSPPEGAVASSTPEGAAAVSFPSSPPEGALASSPAEGPGATVEGALASSPAEGPGATVEGAGGSSSESSA